MGARRPQTVLVSPRLREAAKVWDLFRRWILPLVASVRRSNHVRFWPKRTCVTAALTYCYCAKLDRGPTRFRHQQTGQSIRARKLQSSPTNVRETATTRGVRSEEHTSELQ